MQTDKQDGASSTPSLTGRGSKKSKTRTTTESHNNTTTRHPTVVDPSQPFPMPFQLFSMIGDNSPTLSMSVGGHRPNKRAKLNDGQAVEQQRTRWEWRAFENAARKDSLMLHHWEKVDPNEEAEQEGGGEAGYTYPFAKYNVSSNVYSYSKDEYLSYLIDESGDWSREETDYLFTLCQQYDLRWFVIKDRWDWPPDPPHDAVEQSSSSSSKPVVPEIVVQTAESVEGEASTNANNQKSDEKPGDEAGSTTPTPASDKKDENASSGSSTDAGVTVVPSSQTTQDSNSSALVVSSSSSAAASSKPTKRERTIEEMKERYYSVCRKLIRARPAGDETAKAALLHSYAFERDRETARKNHLANVLFTLSPEQIAEEEFLYVESRRLEQTYTKTARDREELWRLLGGVGPQSSLSAAMGTNGSVGTPFFGTGPGGTSTPTAQYTKDGKKRRRGEVDFLEDAPPGGGGAAGGAGQKGAGGVTTPQLTPAQDAQLGIIRYDTANTSAFTRPSGVHLRSSKPPQLKTSLASKITIVLQEQQISMRLAMPTRANMEKLEALTSAITNLLDVKKQVERAEHELKILKTRKEAATRIEEEDRKRALAIKQKQEEEEAEKEKEKIAKEKEAAEEEKKKQKRTTTMTATAQTAANETTDNADDLTPQPEDTTANSSMSVDV